MQMFLSKYKTGIYLSIYHNQKLTDYSQCSFQSRDRQENPFDGRDPAARG